MCGHHVGTHSNSVDSRTQRGEQSCAADVPLQLCPPWCHARYACTRHDRREPSHGSARATLPRTRVVPLSCDEPQCEPKWNDQQQRVQYPAIETVHVAISHLATNV